jgi:hypothetical protein
MPKLVMSRNVSGKSKAGSDYYEAQWDGRSIVIAVAPDLNDFLRANLSDMEVWDPFERLAKSKAATGNSRRLR